MAEVYTGRKFAKLKRYSLTLKKYVMPIAQNPDEKDQITNADESKKLPDDSPEPLEGTKTDDLDLEPEGNIEEGNVAAKKEEDARKLDGSNANNLRTK
jgi:hypothetical protein